MPGWTARARRPARSAARRPGRPCRDLRAAGRAISPAAIAAAAAMAAVAKAYRRASRRRRPGIGWGAVEAVARLRPGRARADRHAPRGRRSPRCRGSPRSTTRAGPQLAPAPIASDLPRMISLTLRSRAKRQQVLRDRAAGDGDRLAAELLGEPQRPMHALALRLRPIVEARRLDEDREPRRAAPLGHATRRAHAARSDSGLPLIATSMRSDTGPGVRVARVRRRCACICSSTCSAVSRSASSRSAVRLAGLEEVAQRPLRLPRARRPCPRCSRWSSSSGEQVDQLHLVGAVEDAVGDRLAHAHAGDLRDDVVQALEVLDVERGVDVDAGVEQLLDVVPALRVARARARWCARARRPAPARAGARATASRSISSSVAPRYSIALPRHDLEAGEQRLGLGAPVRLDDADDDVDAVAHALAAPPGAWRTSCRRRARRRRRP